MSAVIIAAWTSVNMLTALEVNAQTAVHMTLHSIINVGGG